MPATRTRSPRRRCTCPPPSRTRRPSVEQDQWDGDVTDRLSSALDGLDERSRTVIRSRWLAEDKKTLQELGDDYGVSAERIRQIEAVAITKLRSAMSG